MFFQHNKFPKTEVDIEDVGSNNNIEFKLPIGEVSSGWQPIINKEQSIQKLQHRLILRQLAKAKKCNETAIKNIEIMKESRIDNGMALKEKKSKVK